MKKKEEAKKEGEKKEGKKKGKKKEKFPPQEMNPLSPLFTMNIKPQ